MTISDIKIAIPEEEKTLCKICGMKFSNFSSITGHISTKHKTSYEQYIIDYYMNGEFHKCPICGNRTRYAGNGYFKKYCVIHVSNARSEASKKLNNLDYGWKKGLTKNDHDGIKRQSEKILGENNPSKKYGIKPESILKRIKKVTISEEELLKRLGNSLKNVSFSGNYKDYIKRNESKLLLKCNICGREFKKTLSAIEYNGKCPFCFPKGYAMIGKKSSEETKKKLSDINKHSREEFEEIVNLRKNDWVLLTSYENYYNKQHQKLEIQCTKCNNITKRTLIAIQNGTLCYRCYPRSKEQKEIYDYLCELGIESEVGNREIIYPYELDIFVPEKNFSLEYNGLFWHSDKQKSKNYHFNKTMATMKKNINLIHVFSDEWKQKGEIVRSIIKYHLNLIKEKIHARKCIVKEVSREDTKEFFTKNHISGNVSNIINSFGLYFNDTLVSCVSLRKPLKKKNSNVIEIARFCSLINTKVLGGFSKLLKYIKIWTKEKGFEKILTYADLRFGTGNVYEKAGFQKVGVTCLNYWYTDSLRRFSRQKFRAKDGISEKEIAENAGVYKIYGCGSNIYQLEL